METFGSILKKQWDETRSILGWFATIFSIVMIWVMFSYQEGTEIGDISIYAMVIMVFAAPVMFLIDLVAATFIYCFRNQKL